MAMLLLNMDLSIYLFSLYCKMQIFGQYIHVVCNNFFVLSVYILVNLNM